MTNWIELESQVYMQVTKRTPLVLVKGQGTRVWDDQGRVYLDMVGGWATNALGHCHPVMIEAITRQAQTLIHTSNQFYTIPQLELAKFLVDHSALDRVFFANSGTEANEGAVKLARRWGRQERDGAFGIIATHHGFHGRSLTAATLTGKPQYKDQFAPLTPGIDHVPFNDLEAAKRATTSHTVAIMLEPIQGEAGVHVADDDYLRGLRQWCDEQGLLLILDEVQTGAGRTGTLWAYEHAGIEPDIMTVAKGIGGGIPIGGLLAKEKVAAAFQRGDHGTTFGGNPLATATALAVMRYLVEHDIPGNVARVGAYLMQRLESLKGRWPVTEVRGRGLLIAVDFDRDLSAELQAKLVEEGMLVNTPTPSAIRLMPPLILTQDEADEAVDLLERALEKLGVGATT